MSDLTLFDSEPREHRMEASLSICGQYRYDLTRWWGDGPWATWVMLNPSTADATTDDPTIRRCIGFSKREGCSGLRVVNLYALRATHPKELARHADPDGGPENSWALAEASAAARSGELVIVAWGAHPMAEQKAHQVGPRFEDAGAFCLGRTKSGQPRHPLYVRADQPLEPWRAS